jgi:type I restriction enzyme S subunit
MNDDRPKPYDWVTRRFGELFDLDSGAAPVRFRPGDLSGPVLVYGANGVIGSCDEANYGPGYLVGRVGAAGAVAKVDTPIWASDNTLTATPKTEACSQNFAGHLLRRLDLGRLATTTAQPLITQGNLSRLTAEVPRDIHEQSRIAAVLDAVDEATAKTEAVIAKLKQVRAGLLRDLLTRGLDLSACDLPVGRHGAQASENGQLRDPIAHPEQFQDPPLGLIPREWETKTLSALCKHIGSGVTPRGGQDVYTTEGVTFIRSQNVTFEGLLLSDIAFIPEEIHRGMLRSEVFAHDVLFNITGASIGRCCPMPDGLGRANVNQHVCVLRVPDATAEDSTYLASVLASPIGQRQLETLNTFGNRQGLNYQQLGSFVLPWPDRSERKMIADRIVAADAQRHAAEREKAKLTLLKSGLMTDLLTGRVRVREGVGGWMSCLGKLTGAAGVTDQSNRSDPTDRSNPTFTVAPVPAIGEEAP